MRTRHVTIAIIIGLVLINYIDRSAISYAVVPLTKEFSITPAQYGAISSAFSIGYMVFALVSGPLVDRFGPRRILIVGMLVWSISTALTPLAGGVVGLMIIRIILGIGEAPGFPAATRLASRWLPQKERGIALSLIGGVAVSGSLLIGGPIVTQLIAATTWRGMFWILALIGLVWVVVAAFFLKNTPSESARTKPDERAYIEAGQLDVEHSGRQQKLDWNALLTNRNLWIVGAGYFAWGFMFWGFLYWLPSYLSVTYKLNITSVGAFSVAPWAAGCIGAVVGGIVVDRVYTRTKSIRSRFIIMGVALLLSGASLAPIAFAPPTLGSALTFISLGVGFGFITGGIWWVVAIDCAPNQPATAAGFADACFGLSGIAAPLIMGFIVQGTGTYTSGFVLMSVLAVVGALLLIFVTRKPVTEILATERDLETSKVA
jgi:MFS family permease